MSTILLDATNAQVRTDAAVRGYNSAPTKGFLQKTITDADYTLSATEMECPILEVAGTLTADRNIIAPLTAGAEYKVFNNTTGGHNLTIKAASGTGIAIAAGKRAIVYCDGTNYERLTPDT